MILAKYTKQPAEFKDYDVDFAPWLLPMGDTLDDVQVSIVCETDEGDTSLVCSEVQLTTTRCKLWIAGGTVGQKYKVTLLTTSVGTRVDESELVFTIKDY